eukprot:m.11850 g.11850  ORF g.11850 m.11850 type:complete len:854 (-) comp4480_c0_seq1:109-2670(-)
MPRLIHRAACVALAAAAALGTARAAYIFDAHNCNTNFDGDVRNWDNPPFGSGTTPPMRIRFGAANATWRPVNVLVAPGTYRFGGLQLQDNMVISLPSDGAVFHLDEQATGPVSSFIAGQSDVPRCDAHCASNYRVGTLQQANSTDYTSLNLPLASTPPCTNDDVALPAGYATQVQMYGFVGVRSFVNYGPTLPAAASGSGSGNNGLSIYPPNSGMPMLGQSAVGYCAANGILDVTASGTIDTSACACPTSCHPTGTTRNGAQAFIGAVYGETSTLLQHAALQATPSAADTTVSAQGCVFTYVGLAAGPPPTNPAAVQGISALAGTVQSAAFPVDLAAALGGVLPRDARVTQVSATWSAAGAAGDGSVGTLTVRYTLSAPGAFLRGLLFSKTYTPLTGWVSPTVADTVGMATFKALASTLTAAGVTSTNQLESGAGYAQRTKTLTLGANLPQAALPQLINQVNAVGFARELQQGLNNANGIIQLSESALASGFTVVSQQQVAAWRGSNASAAGGSGVSSSAPVGQTYGFATNLVRVTLSYWSFVDLFTDPTVVARVTAKGNRIAALHNFTAGSGPCQDITLTVASQQACVSSLVTARVDALIASTFPTDTEHRLATMTPSERATQTANAEAAGVTAVTDVYGDCGPLGAQPSTSTSGSTPTCVDASWAGQAMLYGGMLGRAAFNARADNAVASTAAPTATPTAAPTAAPSTGVLITSGANTGGGGGGGGILLYIIIAVVVAVLVLIVAAVLYHRLNEEAEAAHRTTGVAFENPLYSPTDADDVTYSDLATGGVDPAYDTVAMAGGGGSEETGYLDVSAGDTSGYMDIPVTSGTGTGYLDVASEDEEVGGFDGFD